MKPSKVENRDNVNKSISNLKGIYIGIFLLSFLIYAHTLSHGFVLDDPLALELNKNVTSGLSGIKNIVSGGYRENSFGGHLYRPVPLVMFAVEWAISPNNPWIHHFMSVLWYALSCVFVFIVLKRWTNLIVFSLVAALIFAVHPIHTEVVANIKSRDEIMSLFFLLVSWISWDNYHQLKKQFWLFATVVLYLLALLSKETAITMFPVFGWVSWAIYKESPFRALKNGAYFMVPVGVLLLIRQVLFGDLPPIQTHIMDNPILGASGLMESGATSMLILWQYIQLLMAPYPLSSDYSYAVLPLAKWTDVKVIMGLIVHLGFLGYLIKNFKQRSFLSLSIVSYLMALSLFSQIFITIGTMFGERLVYLGSFWFIVGLVFLLTQSTQNITDFMRSKPIYTVFFTVIMGLFIVLTLQRNVAWKDNYTLFTTDVKNYPRSVRLNNGCAEELIKMANRSQDVAKVNAWLNEAEGYIIQSMEVKPVPTAYLALGNIRLKQAQYEEAIQYYNQVNDLKDIVNTNKALAYRELGRIAGEKEGDISKSQAFLKNALNLNDKDPETWFLMGVSYGVGGQHLEAAQNFEKAFQLKPEKGYAQNIIRAYQNVGNTAKVQEYTAWMAQLEN